LVRDLLIYTKVEKINQNVWKQLKISQEQMGDWTGGGQCLGDEVKNRWEIGEGSLFWRMKVKNRWEIGEEGQCLGDEGITEVSCMDGL